ncbi:MAG: 50S ribosomal protein L17 [Polyangiaceae bacterium UTPRO1]|jgi:large subunit ribosomal protein L17|nr:MAG: 50S ribosomal protein L17 [Polyangiaceae bacterium UTPRO1]
MRHLNAGRKLNRSASHRRALFRNLVTALLERERIRTTDAKAKETRRLAERMITLGKQGTLAARRRALGFVQSRAVVKKLFDDIAPRFKERSGGYTRIIKVGIRHGDAAPVSVIELVTRAADLEAASGGDKKKRRGAARSQRAQAKGSKGGASEKAAGKRAAAG